jgi:AcrR family transcriptional regulator
MSRVGRPRVHDEETRATLRAAAERLVAEGGASAFSVRAVAVRAGTCTRAIYSLFGSKEGLLRRARAGRVQVSRRRNGEHNETDDPAADLVEMGVSVYRRLVLTIQLIASLSESCPIFASAELTEARERSLRLRRFATYRRRPTPL